MNDGLLLARMILAIAALIFALSVIHSANAEVATEGDALINSRCNIFAPTPLRLEACLK
jgi:hypothetical protein